MIGRWTHSGLHMRNVVWGDVFVYLLRRASSGEARVCVGGYFPALMLFDQLIALDGVDGIFLVITALPELYVRARITRGRNSPGLRIVFKFVLSGYTHSVTLIIIRLNSFLGYSIINEFIEKKKSRN
jgi:hypothetical protein